VHPVYLATLLAPILSNARESFEPFSEIRLWLHQWLPLLQFEDWKILEIIRKLGFFVNIVNVDASVSVLHTSIVNANVTITIVSPV
jgi:hypothetical protein